MKIHHKNIFNQPFKLLVLFFVAMLSLVWCHIVLANEELSLDCNDKLSPFVQRACVEKGVYYKPFALIPHKQNYIVGSHVSDLKQQNEIYDEYETKFQISFKVPINQWRDDTKWVLFFAYTQLSVWQMLNFKHSAPFRDTNYEPEIMLYRLTNTNILGWKMRLINFGLINHQSNGQTPPYSRSWNRSYVEFLMEKGRTYIALKGWHRWNEKKKNDPDEYEGDDNPNIEEYVGHGELRIFHIGEKNNVGLTIRDTTHGDDRGSIQLDWTYPIPTQERMRFYFQYFDGYGETLIDYNIKRRRIGLGFTLANWM